MKFLFPQFVIGIIAGGYGSVKILELLHSRSQTGNMFSFSRNAIQQNFYNQVPISLEICICNCICIEA